MTGTEDNERRLVGDRIDWGHLFGGAVLALALAAVVVAVPGAIAGQDQPGDPVSIYGDAEDELNNTAQNGTTIYAIVNGTVEDSITVDENGQFGGGAAFEDKLTVTDGAGSEVLFTIDSPEGTVALDTVNLTSADEVVEMSLTFPVASFAEIDVNGDGNLSTDTTGDGLLNDVDGDGEFDIFDIQTLFTHFNQPIVQDNAPAFDFDDDGEVDIFDVQELFDRLG